MSILGLGGGQTISLEQAFSDVRRDCAEASELILFGVEKTGFLRDEKGIE